MKSPKVPSMGLLEFHCGVSTRGFHLFCRQTSTDWKRARRQILIYYSCLWALNSSDFLFEHWVPWYHSQNRWICPICQGSLFINIVSVLLYLFFLHHQHLVCQHFRTSRVTSEKYSFVEHDDSSFVHDKPEDMIRFFIHMKQKFMQIWKQVHVNCDCEDSQIMLTWYSSSDTWYISCVHEYDIMCTWYDIREKLDMIWLVMITNHDMHFLFHAQQVINCSEGNNWDRSSWWIDPWHVVLQIPRNCQTPDTIISLISFHLIYPRCIFLLYHSEIGGKESRYSMTLTIVYTLTKWVWSDRNIFHGKKGYTHQTSLLSSVLSLAHSQSHLLPHPACLSAPQIQGRHRIYNRVKTWGSDRYKAVSD